MKENKIKIIVPFFNASEFLERCVSSIMSQKYSNFKVIFVDDASTDNSWELLPHDDPRVICIKNDVNVTALPNIHNSIMQHVDTEDIVILVDGDDWLPNKKVFSYINEYYNKHDCWIMYGQAQWSTGQRGFASAYPKGEFDNIRTSPFRVSHIRSFRGGLYHKIKEQDPEFKCMKDELNNWYTMTYDVAVMFPIIEMSPFEKVKFNDKILYIYNFENPESDHRKSQQLQTGIHMEINKKPRFKQIKSYN